MKNKKKKAFTLVELLAVIVILAVILIIAVPQITETIKVSRLKAIESSTKLVITNAEKDYLSQQTLDPNYNAATIACDEVVELDNNYDSCKITYDAQGKATVKLVGKDGGKFDNTTCVGTSSGVECHDTAKKCYCNGGTMSAGTSCQIGAFTYQYKRKSGTSSWSNISDNGWGVILTNKTSTAPVTEPVCTYVNDKPVVAYSFMFYNSKATSIDVSEYQSKNVNQFNGMFDSAKATEIIGISNLDISNSTTFFRMFKSMTNITTLDLTGWDTVNSSVTNYGSMFNGCTSLTTIYASPLFVVSNNATSTGMFTNCSNIVGGNDTHYLSTAVAGTYAKIDGLNGTPGYFTEGPAA